MIYFLDKFICLNFLFNVKKSSEFSITKFAILIKLMYSNGNLEGGGGIEFVLDFQDKINAFKKVFKKTIFIIIFKQ